MKIAIQITIIALGIAASVYGISKMVAETTTMILPVWLIILIISSLVCAGAMGIGLLAKYLLRSGWHFLTFTSLIVIIVVGVYATIEYKPTFQVSVSPGYVGAVKLFVSRDTVERYDITVNNFGIGYITSKTFDKGFYPKIVKGQRDITREIKGYSKGYAMNSLSERYSLNYLSFDIPGGSSPLSNDITELIRIGAIDTTRLQRKSVH